MLFDNLQQTAYCSNCRKHKDPSEFHVDSKTPNGLSYWCKECVIKERAEYRRNNPEKIVSQKRKYMHKYLQKPEVKARYTAIYNKKHKNQIDVTDDGTITNYSLADLRLRQDNRCAYCFIDLDSVVTELDHIIPLSKNGTHSINNVVYACLTCNRSKNDKLLDEWL